MFELAFTRRYAMAHRLISGLSPKCAVPHGHNEFVTVRLRAAEPNRLDGEANMVEPFERAKRLWHRWIDDYVDHALQLSAADPLLSWFEEREPERLARILVTPGDPTTEMLACCFKAKLSRFLDAEGGRLRCIEVRVEETPTNSVTFDGNPTDALPAGLGEDRWWQRPDMSINEFGPIAAGMPA
jgi:6-pyruvoyltetrahydropterin/6-carboxytetrahydropterin synthase